MPIILTSLLLILGCSAAWAGSSIQFRQEQLGNVFYTTQNAQFAVETSGELVEWVVTDFFAAEIARGTERVSAGRSVIGPVRAGKGYFEIEARAFSAGGEVGSARTSFAVIEPPSRSTADDVPFGVMTHFAQGWETDLVELIARAGIRHVRDEQYWAGVERNRGEYAFPTRYTGYMAALRAQGLEPLIALTFENKNYDDGLSPHTDEGRAGYAGYAQAVLNQYGGEVRVLEVWNEYNGTFCKGPCRLDRAGHYAKMLEAAYRRIKSSRPDVTVLGGAAVLAPLPWFEALFTRGALDFMDGVVIHPYRPVPEGVERDVAALQALIARFNGGRTKPIWATEIGRQDHGPQGRHNVARYLARMYTLLMSVGVERIYWYLMRDYAGFRTMGLLRAADSDLGRYAPAPAYAAYANLIHQLHGARFVRRERTDPRTHAYLFERGGTQIRVIWSPGAPVDLRLSADRPVTIVDIMGRERQMNPRDGTMIVTADENPIYVHGAITAISDVGRERLLADATADYSVTAQGQGGWYYGYFT
ncbi:MAG TPA: hypothetical protein VHM01_20125, partial [Alphaproteobacteria bacterium]|nr:hypothetical protein [Alphaproteobacteria bacterium]